MWEGGPLIGGIQSCLSILRNSDVAYLNISNSLLPPIHSQYSSRLSLVLGGRWGEGL